MGTATKFEDPPGRIFGFPFFFFVLSRLTRESADFRIKKYPANSEKFSVYRDVARAKQAIASSSARPGSYQSPPLLHEQPLLTHVREQQ